MPGDKPLILTKMDAFEGYCKLCERCHTSFCPRRNDLNGLISNAANERQLNRKRTYLEAAEGIVENAKKAISQLNEEIVDQVLEEMSPGLPIPKKRKVRRFKKKSTKQQLEYLISTLPFAVLSCPICHAKYPDGFEHKHETIRSGGVPSETGNQAVAEPDSGALTLDEHCL